MTDYKHTLNLPETEFSMRGNLSQREPQMLEQWYADHVYGQIRKAKAGRPKAYVFQYRPPNKAFSLKLNFRKADVPADEVIAALEGIIDDLRKQ